MDRWRDFFSRAGDDLWTIIEQAIIVAATDYPQDFRSKRCEIAETLFAGRPAQLAGNADQDATRISGSLVTNSIVHNETRVGDEKAKIPEHAPQRQSPSRDINYEEGKACLDVWGGEKFVTAEVENVKELLASSEQTEDFVLNALKRLESLQITVEVLKATEIGKQINNLRKHASRSVQMLARGLVRRWKELVDKWASETHGGNAVEANMNVGDVPSPFCLNKKGLPLTRLASMESKVRNEDLSDKRGSSRRAGVSVGMANMLPWRVNDIKSSRPCPRTLLNEAGDMVSNDFLDHGSKVTKFASDTDGSQSGQVWRDRYHQLKPILANEILLTGKLETVKKKPHDGYAQAENAKKQRVA